MIFVIDFSPAQLLENPSLVAPIAPWCSILDNLDLGIILLAQPWLTGTGLRRADFEGELGKLAAGLPVGPLYFQRVSRAVANLEERGVLSGSGTGRDRRFVLTPEGFGALILNLHVLRGDPTLDGSEFEFKRELSAMWNVMIDRLMSSPPEIALAPEMAAFFGRVDALSILGKQVVTTAVVTGAFNVLRLISHQRDRVMHLKMQADVRLAETRAQVEFLRTADLSQIDLSAMGESAKVLKDHPALLDVIRSLATSAAPQLGVEAQIIRYGAYLTYLDDLGRAYARELKVVDITAFRRRVVGA